MSDYTKGLIITLLGVVAISPDTLLIRLIDAPTFTQLFWRGLLSGSIVILGFAALKGRHTLKAMRAQGWPGIWIAIIFSLGTILFVYFPHRLISRLIIESTLFSFRFE